MKSQTQLVWLAALLCSLYLAAAQNANVCPDGTQPANCDSTTSFNRCSVATCPLIPNARCVPNACEDCAPNFFDGENNNVTERCRACPSGMVYRDCGSPCPPTCDVRTPVCLAVCTPGCFCSDDTMVLNDDGVCIPPSDCPADPCDTTSCAPLRCADGTQPVTTNLECCSACPACLDDVGQLVEAGEIVDTDNDPCTTCFCTEYGQVDCVSIVCAPIECRGGVEPVYSEDECCPHCPDHCELVDCADKPVCTNGTEPFIPPGECCYQCPNDPCATVRCASPSCIDNTEPIIPDGQCCPVCPQCLDSSGGRRPPGDLIDVDDPCKFCSCTQFGGITCAIVDCPYPLCPDGNEPVRREGECCPTCDPDTTLSPCATVLCAFIDQCPDGSEPFTPPNECCPRCRTCVADDGTVYESGDTFSDGCNTCYCSATGNIVCTLRACPDPCSLPPQSGACLAYIPRYYYNSSTETCQRFIYGGCGGNENNFETVHDCLAECNRDSVCLRPVYPEDFLPVCDVLSRQWTFNSTLGRCEVINYADCGESREGYNVFHTERECNRTCIDPRPRCPDGSEPVNCFADPCEVTSCPAFPNARCVSSFCGGCNATYFDEEGNDVTASCRGKCNSPIYPPNYDPLCDAILLQWTYNTTSRQCMQFDYSACGEDREQYNVFRTEEACDVACERHVCRDGGVEYRVGQVFPAGDGCNNCTCLANGLIACTLIACRNPCSLEPEVGDCDGVFPRYFYNQSAEMCQRFNYGGCGGNKNNFETARECLKKCDNGSVCNQPVYPPNFEPTCAVIVGKWTYNSTVGRCHEIGYAACGEQREGYNVFDTERECNNTCVSRPGCDNIVSCFADPCEVTSCPSFPNARCVSNYCGGCNAWFFDSNGNNVTDRCRTDISVCELPRDSGSDECSDNLPRLYYNSSVGVCQRFRYSGCGGNRNNFNNGAACWRTCNPHSICNQPIYPRGYTPTCRVLVRRWTYNVTAAGCQEIEYSPCDEESEGYNVFRTEEQCLSTCVTPPLPGPTCPDGSEPVNCFADPCEVTSCPAFPNARCVSSFCGGCNANFFDGEGNDVTARCRVILPTPIQVEVCPQVNSDTLGTCPVLCSDDDDCGDGMLCCSNGCGFSCMAAVQVPYYRIPRQCPVDDDSLLDVCAISSDSERCLSDEDCDDDELCCRSGCGRVCRESVRSTQPCFAITDLFNQTLLLGSRLSTFVGSFIPQCNRDGSFNPIQCHGSTGYCWCVHTRTGLPLSAPLRGEPECSSCTYNGETYYAGERFPSMDGCNDCFCGVNGAVGCTERACIDTCSLDADPGPCRGAFPAYYYDDETGSCRQFTYGGCQGNDNKFETVRDCFRRCDPDNVCLLRADPGPCEAFVPSIFFNATSGRCERFIYGGCSGNENRFVTGAACQRACDPSSPIDPCLDVECPELVDCPDSRRVREPGECCAKCAPEECDDDEFLCSNGRCISGSFRCDGLTDCDEGEDEDNCPRSCDFMCGDGVCIPERYVCDGYLDCRDGSDARNCPIEFENTFFPQDIPRQCPNATGLIGACVIECSSDSDCENGGLCCSNGCGRTCMRGEPVTPLCPALLRRISTPIPGAFIPSCESDGSFSQIQCHGSTGFCWCVDTVTGQPLSNGVRGEPDCGGCTDHNNVTYGFGDSFLDEDGCNNCYCTASFGALCTRRDCNPEPCKIGDRIIEHNSSFSEDCVLCRCLFGVLNCTKRPCAITAAIRRRLTRIRMAFNGNFDDLLPSDDTMQEISREWRRILKERYADLMGLLEEQVTDITFERGSVIVIFTVSDTDSDTGGANVTVFVAQLEQDYQDGNLVLRFNGEVLEPAGQFQAEDATGTEDEVGFPWWGILIIVLGAVFFALAVVILIVALIICCRKKPQGHSPLSDRADFPNDYEVPTKKGFDSTGDSTDLKKTPL